MERQFTVAIIPLVYEHVGIEERKIGKTTTIAGFNQRFLICIYMPSAPASVTGSSKNWRQLHQRNNQSIFFISLSKY
jgi:hypothetical protein